MKIYQKLLCAILFGVVSTMGIVSAQNSENEPPKYRMEQVYIFEDAKPIEYIFVLNGSVGFKSVKALKQFIEKLPPETIIEWRPSCEILGDEPLRSSEKEMADFKAFCESKKVKFILVPAG